MENSRSFRKNSCYFPQSPRKITIYNLSLLNKYKFGVKNFLPTIDGVQSEVSDMSAQVGKMPSEVSDTSARFWKKPSESSDAPAQVGKVQSEPSDTSAQFRNTLFEVSDFFAQHCEGKIHRIKTSVAAATATYYNKGVMKKARIARADFFHDKFPLETCIFNAHSHCVANVRKKSIESCNFLLDFL